MIGDTINKVTRVIRFEALNTISYRQMQHVTYEQQVGAKILRNINCKQMQEIRKFVLYIS